MGEQIKLLLVEDNAYDAALLTHSLQKAGMEVDIERVENEQGMRRALQAKDWDAVISDYLLPSFSAPNALEIVRQSGKDLPFIVVSGTIEEVTAIEIMRSGAHDYLMKNNLQRLAEALRREIREARARLESKKAEAALRANEELLRLLFERSNDAIFMVDKTSGRYINANHAAEILTGRSKDVLTTLTVMDTAPIGAAERLMQISSGSSSFEFEEVIYQHPDGATRTAQLTVLSMSDQLAFGIAHDITEQVRAENALKRRAQELEVLYRTSLEINSQAELLPLLQNIVEQAAGLLNTPMGGLYLMRPDGQTLELVVGCNLPKKFIGSVLQLGEGLSGLIAQTGKTTMVADYQTWENSSVIYRNFPFRRVIGLPLRVKEQVIGVINISDSHQTGFFTDDEVRLASLFADQAAIAVENARLLSAAQHELTERKQAELALRESEEHYRIVVTKAPLITFVINADGVFTLSEGKGLSALGLNPGQVVGQSVFEMYKNYPDIIEDMHAALLGETRRRDTKVGEHIFEIHYIPFLDEKGKTSHVIGVANDISERKKAEQDLRSTQDFLDRVLKAVPLGISIYNLKTAQMEFDNAPNITFNGLSIAQFNSLTPAERWAMVHPEDRERRAAFMKDLLNLEDGEVRDIEYRRTGADNQWRWFKYRYFVFERDGNGRVLKLLSITEDVTTDKQSEQALQRQLKELSLLHTIASNSIQVNTIDELVELVTNEVGSSFYLDNFGVLFLNEARDNLLAHASYRGLSAEARASVSIDGSLVGQVIKNGKPRRVANVRLEPHYLKTTEEIQSELCVPIFAGDHPIGAINAESTLMNFFSAEDERLLLTVAGQMTIAIERIWFLNSEQARRQEAETLRQATAALSTSLDLDHVLESILTSLKQVVPFDSASVFLLEEKHLRITIVDGMEATPEIMQTSYPADDPLFLEVKMKRQPVILADAQADPHFRKWGNTHYVRGWMSVPLITRDEVIGYITLDSRQTAAYSQESGTMAQAFAYQAAAAIENARLYKGLQESLGELNQAYDSTIEGWSRAMDLRDKETEGHTQRVTELTLKLAVSMGIEGDELLHIRRGALLHDIGKMGVPDRILLKPDNLTDDEMLIMRQHPSYALDMLSSIAYLHPALDIPYCHHELWNGKGYPRGLKGEQIPLAARLFTVIDVWDALTSNRPYRPAWSRKETLEYIKKLSGENYDPQIVEIFVKLIEETTG